jgi:hypothetical protein
MEIAGETVRDGFQDLLFFPGHGRSVRGFNIISMKNEKGRKKKTERVLSWDVKGIYLWNNDGIILRNIKFPKTQQNYISCIVYIPRLGGNRMSLSMSMF